MCNVYAVCVRQSGVYENVTLATSSLQHSLLGLQLSLLGMALVAQELL